MTTFDEIPTEIDELQLRTVREEWRCPQCDSRLPESAAKHEHQQMFNGEERTTTITCHQCCNSHRATFIRDGIGGWVMIGTIKRLRAKRISPRERMALECATGERQLDPDGQPLLAAS